MPNFITKNINSIKYPYIKDDISLLWSVEGRNEKLIYCQNSNDKFFITIKQKDDKNFIVKGDKLSKPPRLSSLQKALCFFKDEFCVQIISEAIQVKNKKEPKTAQNIIKMPEISKLLELIKEYKKTFIEIGFGSGRHLLFQAKNNPKTLIIGIEVYKPSMEQVSKLADLNKLENIALINTDARLLLSLIPSNLIEKIFLHFPVPWDDSPHRRVVSNDFALECQRVLKNGGKFELRSDSKMYTDFTCATFLGLKNARIQIQKNVNLEISSKYEDRWKRQEKDIYDLFFTCEHESDELEQLDEMVFDDRYDIQKIIKNFKNTTLKYDDFFIHFEEIYNNKNDIAIIRLAFGSFNKPEHCFLKFQNKTCEYFIKKPIPTKTNLKAHDKIKEVIAKCKI